MEPKGLAADTRPIIEDIEKNRLTRAFENIMRFACVSSICLQQFMMAETFWCRTAAVSVSSLLLCLFFF